MFDCIRPTFQVPPSTFHIQASCDAEKGSFVAYKAQTMYDVQIKINNPELGRLEELMDSKVDRGEQAAWRHCARLFFGLRHEMIADAVHKNNIRLDAQIGVIGLFGGALVPAAVIAYFAGYGYLVPWLLTLFACVIELARRFRRRIKDGAAFLQHLQDTQEERIDALAEEVWGDHADKK